MNGGRHERDDQRHGAGADHHPEAGRAETVVSPDGTVGELPPPRARIDSTLIKALARAHRWKRMLDDGRYGSVSELAAAEKLEIRIASKAA